MQQTKYFSLLNFHFLIMAVFFAGGLIVAIYSHAETDVQLNNKQGKEVTPLMPELSCAKNARRIKKLDNKLKRRKFIKQCQAERAVIKEAEKLAKEWEKEKKQEAAEKDFQDFLKKGKKRAEKIIDEDMGEDKEDK